MTGFNNALRSEWTKMTSLRSTWIYVILLVGSMVGPVVLQVSMFEGGFGIDWQSLTVGTVLFAMIAIAYAGASIAGEYNDQMHAHAFLTQDRRSLWIVARGLLELALLLVTWLLGLVIAYLVVVVWPGVSFEGGAPTAAVTSVLTFSIFAVIAMALGVLTRSRVAAVAIPLVWLLVVEQLVKFAAMATKAMVPVWLAAPGERISQLADQLTGNRSVMDNFEAMLNPPLPTGFQPETIQPMWFNVAVLVAWVAVAIAVSLWVNAKRDVR